MRNQPRDTNNPANPLIKVAALEIRRANEKAGRRQSCDVSVTLNFKKSADMRGSTIDRRGAEITVNFTLEIRRATLEISFLFENTRDNTHLKPSKIAFV